MTLATQLTKDIYIHQNKLKHINIINDDGFSALFVVNTPVYDNSGVAHGVEHMVFRASAAFPQSESLFQLTSLTDAKINASTFANRTYFHCQSHCSQTFSLAIDYLLNGLLNPIFLAKDLACEIHDGKDSGVIYRELIGAEQLAEQASNKPPKDEFLYGGDSALIGHLSLSDLTRFHQRYYQASNITLVTANADIEQIASIISSLPKQKKQIHDDKQIDTIALSNSKNDSKRQKKYSKEINQLITLYQQWLQDPYHQEIDDFIEVVNSTRSTQHAIDTIQTFTDSRLISPLISLSNTLKVAAINDQGRKTSVKKAPMTKSLPSLFTTLYQQAKNQLTQQITHKTNSGITYAKDGSNGLWLTHISEAEQKLANIVSYIISAHPVFLFPRCQGQCYAVHALTLENSKYLAIYSAFDITPNTRLNKISSYLLTISQDKSFIKESLYLAKTKYCSTEHVEINEVNEITPLNIATYLQSLANRPSS